MVYYASRVYLIDLTRISFGLQILISMGPFERDNYLMCYVFIVYYNLSYKVPCRAANALSQAEP